MAIFLFYDDKIPDGFLDASHANAYYSKEDWRLGNFNSSAGMPKPNDIVFFTYKLSKELHDFWKNREVIFLENASVKTMNDFWNKWRENVKEIYSKRFGWAETALFVAGNLSSDELKKLVSKIAA